MNSIIITGANRGIGFECALHLASLAPNDQIILACRDIVSGEIALEKIAQKTGHKHLKCMYLDLGSLQSIKKFRDDYAITGNTITTLINNAGIQNVCATKYTEDGFEETFGINHLGPFYLTLLLLPFMDNSGSITFNSSGTHDPAGKHPVSPPVYTNPEVLAHPVISNKDQYKVGQQRYTTSKLCNILTVYELQKRLQHTNISVNAFDPGMVPGTGLTRTYPFYMRFIWKKILPIFTHLKPNINTPEESGKNLANLSYKPEYKIFKGKYFEGKKVISSSADSYNEDYQKDLWKTSVALTGIRKADTPIEL